MNRIIENAINRNTRDSSYYKPSYISKNDEFERVFDYDAFIEELEEFYNATSNRSGINTNIFLQNMIDILSASDSIPDSLTDKLVESNFFEYAWICLDPNEPTLLTKIIRVFSLFAYFSSDLVSLMRENSTLHRICDLFNRSTFHYNTYDSFMRLFSNFGEDSPESRDFLLKFQIFQHICNIIMMNDDPFIIKSSLIALKSFFPITIDQLSNEYADQVILPLKSIIIRFSKEESYENEELYYSILQYTLVIIQIYCSNIPRIQYFIQSGTCIALLNIMYEIKESHTIIIFEILSIFSSTMDNEILEHILPLLDIRYMITIAMNSQDSIRPLCDFFLNVFEYDPTFIPTAFDACLFDVIEYSIKKGTYDIKKSVLNLITIIFNSSIDERIKGLFYREDIIESMIEYWDVEYHSSKSSPLFGAISSMYKEYYGLSYIPEQYGVNTK